MNKLRKKIVNQLCLKHHQIHPSKSFVNSIHTDKLVKEVVTKITIFQRISNMNELYQTKYALLPFFFFFSLFLLFSLFFFMICI